MTVTVDFSRVDRPHVLQALAEYDELGGEAFLDTYGFKPARTYLLVHDGKSYDSKAVLGVAHRYATGVAATSEDFSGGLHGAVKCARGALVFEIDTSTPEQRDASRSVPKPLAPPGPRPLGLSCWRPRAATARW